MKITVTGAAGRLGQHVVKALHAEGHEIVATDGCYRGDLPVRVHVMNLSDTDACYRIVEGSEIVVHLGNQPGVYQAKPQATYTNNVNANANIFQAAQHTGVKKIIFASSVQAFSGNRYLRNQGATLSPSQLPYLPLDGHIPPNPGNLYGASKVAGENLLAYYAKFHGISTISIRFPFLLLTTHKEIELARVHRDLALDEGFSYLALPDAARLVSAIINAQLPGHRVYLPVSFGTLLSSMSMEEIITRYYPDVPRRPLTEPSNLVDITEITRDTGWTPEYRM